MGIYHMKKQTENIPRSCSYLLLKTLLYFISQCTSVPYLESGLCKLDKELDNCNFYIHLARKHTFLIKVIMKYVNIKLWDILDGFHYILNAPRMLYRFVQIDTQQQHKSCMFCVCIFCYSFSSRNFVPPQYLKSRGITLLLF